VRVTGVSPPQFQLGDRVKTIRFDGGLADATATTQIVVAGR
jgi:hypothetical protein